jgi:hypothetical protein
MSMVLPEWLPHLDVHGISIGDAWGGGGPLLRDIRFGVGHRRSACPVEATEQFREPIGSEHPRCVEPRREEVSVSRCIPNEAEKDLCRQYGWSSDW